MVDISHCDYNRRVNRLLAKAEFDFDAAAELLLLFAKYIRRKNERPIPGALRLFIANAIEASMTKEVKNPKEKNKPKFTKKELAKKTSNARNRALLQELKLRATNSRKKGDPYIIGTIFERLQKSNPDKSESQVFKLVADEYMRVHKVSMTIASLRSRRNEYLDASKRPE